MQSEASSRTSPSPAAIVGIVGGALLVIGSFLTWATASVNLDALAQALGVDPGLLQGVPTGSQSFSVGGLDSGADGTFTLIAGIVAVVVAIVLIVKADLRKPMGAVLVLAGLIGGGVALYDLSKVNDVKQEAIDAAGGGLAAAGIDTGVLDEVFDVSAGIGSEAGAGSVGACLRSDARDARRRPGRHDGLGVRTTTFTIDTGGRRVVDVSDQVRRFAAQAGSDGLLHAFLPHATAGLALIETGAGTEPDLEETVERFLPRDDRYRHRHGSIGHGGDHVLPAFISPSLVLPVVSGEVALGIWQSVVVVDPNRENDTRTLRLSFVEG